MKQLKKLNNRDNIGVLQSDQDNIFDQNNPSILDVIGENAVVDELLEGYTVTHRIWEANKNNGVKFSIVDGWGGYSHKDGEIYIGRENVPEDVKTQWGLNKNTSDLDMKKYIFSHENAHHLLFYIFNTQRDSRDGEKILNILKKIRELNACGLSGLGSMSIYGPENRDTAAEEDFAELINRYCINPNILKDRLNYLVNTDANVLKNKGLVKIPQKLVDQLFDLISNLVAIFLKENGVVNLAQR